MTPSRLAVQDPAVQGRMGVMALLREDFDAARPPLLGLASRCQSGDEGRRALLLLAAAELDAGNPSGSPRAALHFARSYLLLPEAPPEEIVLARALYRLAANVAPLESFAADSVAPAPHVAPRFDDCDSAPTLEFRDLPSPPERTLADRVLALEATIAAQSDSLATLAAASAASTGRVAELQGELDRITQLLTSGAQRRANSDHP